MTERLVINLKLPDMDLNLGCSFVCDEDRVCAPSWTGLFCYICPQSVRSLQHFRFCFQFLCHGYGRLCSECFFSSSISGFQGTYLLSICNEKCLLFNTFCYVMCFEYDRVRFEAQLCLHTLFNSYTVLPESRETELSEKLVSASCSLKLH